MKRIKQDTLLFLTACVHPKGMAQTALQDGDVRQQQYLDAIRFYLDKYSYRILVVENTEVDLSSYFKEEIYDGRLECMTFDGNSFDRKLGKGYGEGLIINYAFQHSRFIKECKYLIKVSGRHRVLNLNSIMSVSEWFLNEKDDLVVCEVKPEKNFARSDCYIASKSFYEKYLNEGLLHCNDSKNIWFEHILYRCITQSHKDGFQFLYIPFALDQRGDSGTSGEKMTKTRLRRKLHFFVNMLYYKMRGGNV